MSDAPPQPVDAQLELYRAIMHKHVAALHQTAPALSIPSHTRTSREPRDNSLPSPGNVGVAIQQVTQSSGRILLVEDEPPLARAYKRTLELNGLAPIWVADATSALGELRANKYDVVISDIMLPDHSGLDLLRHVRNCDPDLPMVLVTGSPNLETAIDAVALGAFRYLVKPVSNDRLLGCIAQAQRTRQVARLREEALTRASHLNAPAEGELAHAFERAIEPLFIAYQPIIAWPSRTLHSYQALARSDEPSLALPSALLNAAERLGRGAELNRAVRRSVAKTARALPPGTRVLVNASVEDLHDSELYRETTELGQVASRVTLEFRDGDALDSLDNPQQHFNRLRAIGFRIAVSVSARTCRDLTRLRRQAPDVVKADAGTPGETYIDRQTELNLGRAADWCSMSGRELIVEGVERDDERDRLLEAGCRLFQDCFFTNPVR